MARYEITSPDGARYEITAPDDATPEQVQTYAATQFGRTPKEGSALGAAAEFGKGLARGAIDLGRTAKEAASAAFFPAKVAATVVEHLVPETTKTPGVFQARPADAIERAAGTAGEVVGAGALSGGAGTLPALGRTAAVAAGAAGGEAVGGDVGKFGGMLAAGVTPSSIARTTKNWLANKVSPEVVSSFERAGITPSLGQATGMQWIQGLENLAAKFPGGSGVMARFIENQQKRLGQKIATGKTAEQAGEAIQKGTQRWLESSAKKQNILEEQLGSQMNNLFFQRASATEKALAEMLDPARFQGSPAAMAQAQKDVAPMIAWLADIQAGKQMPFQTIRRLRSRIGEMHTEELVHGRSGAGVDRVYAAMSDDLGRMADAQGMGAQWKALNKHWSERQDKVRNLLQPLLGKPGAKTPEDIFRALIPKNREQSTRIRKVMELLQPEERQAVTRAVVDKLGKATPGRQGEFGETFSSSQFLTNWNNLSKGAKEALFRDPDMRQKVNAIAHAAARIKQGGQVFANPSGTAGSFAAYSVYTAPMGALALLAAGQPGAAAAVAGSAGLATTSAYIGARMLTSPKVVKWLSQRVKPSDPRSIASHLAQLNTIREETDDPMLRDELDRFVQSVSQQ